MFLGLDLGTTNVKAVLVTRDGEVVARGSAPVSLRHVGSEGVEQDIEEIWAATLEAIGRLGDGLGGVRAVGVSAQGGALQLLDGEGQPVGPVISWLDGRGRPYDQALTAELGGAWLAEHIGHGQSGISLGQLLRLRHGGGIGYVGDVIVARLCGRRAHDATSLSIAMLHNPSLRAADPELLTRLGIGEDQLPDLVSPRDAAGALLPAVAEQTSLPSGVPVSAAIHDQYAAALGAGAVGPGDVNFGAGTAWVLLAATERLAGPVIPSAFACTHVVEGLYGQMLSLGNGGSSLTWALELVGMAGESGERIDTAIAAAAPGCDGVRCWPFLASIRAAGLGAEAAGRLAGLRLSHKREHILRAVVEGLAFELTRTLGFLTEAGIAPRRLVMGGGAAASRVTPQIIADVAGLPIACTTESEMSALGAAAIARGLVEHQAPLADLARAMAPPVRLVEPGPDAALYRQLFGEYVASLPLAAREERSP